jgi:hypothetical protein
VLDFCALPMPELRLQKFSDPFPAVSDPIHESQDRLILCRFKRPKIFIRSCILGRGLTSVR